MHSNKRNQQSTSSNGEKSRPKSSAVSIIPMLDKFHDIIGGIHVPVDDGVDKLNRKYTLLVFLFLALPIFTKQYIGEPIECFAPVYFAEHQSRYINSYCWTQSTYYMVPVGDPEDDGDQQEPPDRIMPDEVDYFIGFETVTHIGNERVRRVRVNYYQWAPLILLAQGLCFYIPFLIWNSCANNAGVKLRRLLKKASDIASLPPGCQQREALLAEFVDQFHTLVTGEAGWCADLQCGNGQSGANSSNSSLISGSSGQSQQNGGRGHAGARGDAANHASGGPNHRVAGAALDDSTGPGDSGNPHSRHNNDNSTGCCLVSIPIIGSILACCLKPCASFGMMGPSKYLCLLYLAVKSAYVCNVGLQFFLLGQFLGRGYLKHGVELLNRLIVSGEWWSSPRFPLSTLCQVRADMSGGLRSYTCQCVLPINVFNEKIFSVVWFYMAFLLPLNVLSLLFWIYRTFETNRLSYIRLCLWRTRLVELNQIHRTVRRLSQSYLGWDGVFLLRLIEHNHGSIMATLIMSRLWEFYANQMKLQEDANQLALANNAHHTLSNTTTAISNQHQIMMAAAAAAAHQQQQQQQQQQQSHQQHQHPHHHHQQHHHNHSHATGAQANQLAASHGHSHGAPLHPAAAFAGAAAHGQPLVPMVPHAAHGHHAGQVSGSAGHHPLHAANTHHAHPPHGHLGAFAAANATNASLLAQLQHQQQQTATSHGLTSQQQQQSASGNVAGAVAALAAAAAASTNPTINQAAGQPNASGAPISAPGAANRSAHAASAGQSSGSATGQTQNQTNQPTNKNNNNNNNNNNQTSMHQNQSPILLQSLLHAAGANSSQTANGQVQSQVAAQSANNSNQGSQVAAIQQQQQQQQQTNSSSGGQQNATVAAQLAAAVSALATANSIGSSPSASSSSTSNNNQQQVAALANSLLSGSSINHTKTTSFINTTGQQTISGPPLPPPPPAHVVAAVAAANLGSALQTNGPNGALAAARPNLGLPRQTSQQTGGASGNPNNNGNNNNSSSQKQQQQQQPAPPPHTNPILFNMKSSNIQTAASGVRYAPHTIKRT